MSGAGRRIRVCGALLAAILGVGGCVSAGVESPTTGPEEFPTSPASEPATDPTATVGKVSVRYPADWYVVPAGSLGPDWEWGAQSRPGATPRGTIAVGRQSGKVAAVGNGMIGSKRDEPGWKLRDRKPVKITGATKAERIDAASC